MLPVQLLIAGLPVVLQTWLLLSHAAALQGLPSANCSCSRTGLTGRTHVTSTNTPGSASHDTRRCAARICALQNCQVPAVQSATQV
jgi:hypothetical protein